MMVKNKQKIKAFYELPIADYKEPLIHQIILEAGIPWKEYYQFNVKEISNIMKRGNRLFMAGLREMDTTKNYYPDANSTMRLTYGQVGDYKPGEAVFYDYYTTIDGVMQKEDETSEEFKVHPKLKELYELGYYGDYEMKMESLELILYQIMILQEEILGLP